ncbi:alpha/beta fold hydrolase [Alicycliphilus denitrificans]|uniref:alpha/beta fold hydrolase n=1 Tax=Alicycliphilus denitrificans TaxID=179636 RepID=UPI00095C73B8|nr:alpha/beta hydrolase [Alicycliphilus denitrificans]MBN9574247.1 alpha/beta hydrolase [Alicycliphilus denitrificans]OJW85787.1 MAG: alpha/beta hydrolase [Alicycliphilus sp. 69-12]HRO82493.1 alpha/beta hydrolase [Alicycliphilus denitrificans]
MIEPTLKYVPCPGPAAAGATAQEGHRMAYWEWNDTGDPRHPHVIVCAHGLSRQGRDFDTLARRLCRHARVVCPDVAGRGRSDWLADPMDYQLPVYAADMLALLGQLHQQAPIATLDWVGTSMGGLLGMAICGVPDLPLPAPVRRLVLNDVGPCLEWQALQRIGQYLGQPVHFDSLQQAADALWAVSSTFGPHTPQEWLELSRAMVRPAPQGGFVLHYDPAIAVAFRALTPEAASAGEQQMWQLYDRIAAQVLLLRGTQSDLLSPQTAQQMTARGPRARLVEFAGVGHAPTLLHDDQVDVVARFLLDGQGEPAA